MLVLALDLPPRVERRQDPVRSALAVSRYVDAYKLGIGVLVKHGLAALEALAASGRPVIVDLKFADIGDVALGLMEELASSGASAVIAHGFVGVEGALDTVARKAGELGLELILVTSMTHRGSEKYIDKHFRELLEDAARLNAGGVVVPATKPHLIAEARAYLGRAVKVYSPGVGVQGARPGDALCAGADHEIVGRLITGAADWAEASKRVREEQARRLRECRG